MPWFNATVSESSIYGSTVFTFVDFSYLVCIWAAAPRCLCVRTDRLLLLARPESRLWIRPRTRWRPTASSASHLHTDSRRLPDLHRKSASVRAERSSAADANTPERFLARSLRLWGKTHVLNHLINLLLHLFRAPALQTGVEINVLLHGQTETNGNHEYMHINTNLHTDKNIWNIQYWHILENMKYIVINRYK